MLFKVKQERVYQGRVCVEKVNGLPLTHRPGQCACSLTCIYVRSTNTVWHSEYYNLLDWVIYVLLVYECSESYDNGG
jgi:hypothetical protein